MLVITIHYQQENYAFVYDSNYFIFEEVYSKLDKEFKKVLFLQKRFNTKWIQSINVSNIKELLKKTSKQKNYINEISDILFKMNTTKYKVGKENSNEKEFLSTLNDKNTKTKKENTIFSHYRQLTHFKKQPNWNLYDKYKANNKVFEIIDGQEVFVYSAYHPIQVNKMKLMENLKTHEELQEDLFNAWQTPVFISNPYK